MKINLTDQQKKYLGWLIVCVAVVAAGFLGYQATLPPPPAPEQFHPVVGQQPIAAPTAATGSHFTDVNAEDIYSEDDVTVGDDLTVTDGASITRLTTTYFTPTNATVTSLTATDGTITRLSTTYLTPTNATVTSLTSTDSTLTRLSTTYLTATNFTLGGYGQTGAVKYGTAATYDNGAAITHGFGTTPTICMLWPAEITATVTMTTTSFSSNTATHANPIYWLCGK